METRIPGKTVFILRRGQGMCGHNNDSYSYYILPKKHCHVHKISHWVFLHNDRINPPHMHFVTQPNVFDHLRFAAEFLWVYQFGISAEQDTSQYEITIDRLYITFSLTEKRISDILFSGSFIRFFIKQKLSLMLSTLASLMTSSHGNNVALLDLSALLTLCKGNPSFVWSFDVSLLLF